MSVRHDVSKRKVVFQYATIIATLVFVTSLDHAGVSLPKVAMNAYENIASVASLAASVPENPYNGIVAQLDERDRELSAREQALVAEKAELDARYEKMIASNKMLTLIVLGGVTFLLLLLILLNFYYDIRREEDHETKEKVHEGELTTKL